MSRTPDNQFRNGLLVEDRSVQFRTDKERGISLSVYVEVQLALSLEQLRMGYRVWRAKTNTSST
jgi:hypothetical protein